MTTQQQLIPPTIDELLAAYRSRLEADVEKATDSAIKATTRQAEAMDALRFFDAAMVAARTEPEPRAADFSTGDMRTWTEPATAARTKPCPACDGDGRPYARDGSRNGHKKCEMCKGSGTVPDNTPFVHVGPSPEDGGYTSVSCGDRTRFSNLVYAWAETNGVSDPDAWRILDPSGHEVDGRIVVPATSYGCTYTVERRAS